MRVLDTCECAPVSMCTHTCVWGGRGQRSALWAPGMEAKEGPEGLAESEASGQSRWKGVESIGLLPKRGQASDSCRGQGCGEVGAGQWGRAVAAAPEQCFPDLPAGRPRCRARTDAGPLGPRPSRKGQDSDSPGQQRA